MRSLLLEAAVVDVDVPRALLARVTPLPSASAPALPAAAAAKHGPRLQTPTTSLLAPSIVTARGAKPPPSALEPSAAAAALSAQPLSPADLQWGLTLVAGAEVWRTAAAIVAPTRAHVVALDKAAWEAAEPGRAARAKALRAAYLEATGRSQPCVEAPSSESRTTANQPVLPATMVDAEPPPPTGLAGLAASIRQAVMRGSNL